MPDRRALDGRRRRRRRRPRRRRRVRQRTARRPLHRRRRPREREHRPDHRPPHLPRRAQPAGRPHQGRGPRDERPGFPEPVAADAGHGGSRHSGRLRRLDWNGERLFQAAKFGTEMQYQHLVFEEFARTIQPQIDMFIPGVQNYQTEINPAIVAEFAHTVYRFGHSMLTETIDRLDPNFAVQRDRPDPGLPQPAGVRGQRPHPGRGGRRHRPRPDPPGGQRHRRVRDRGPAQQPGGPAAGPAGHQHGARPRRRHSVPERGAA